MITPLTLIVLNTRPYRETSLLVNAYTDVLGRASFVVKGIRTARNRAAASVFHPLSILDTRTYLHTKKDLYQLKEYSKIYLLDNICTNVLKSSIGLFIGELLYKTVKEQEQNPALFRYITQAILQLDGAGEELSDLHLFFTVHLCRFLGYAPDPESFSPNRIYFDIGAARFREYPDASGGTFDKEDSLLLHRILTCPISEARSLSCSGSRRYHFLNSMLHYYGYHMGKIPEIRSLEVLHQVFL
ncbi:MAG: DNA repair protein RecO [Bacteroidetes bacterium ADurb.Bin037]|nr:MAG: DNA repair protein RecO [Bacteroidetes bacterium ADurb.Bin037]HPW77888.1 DNA repair protein RecO [Bacteroidales bacterium]HQB55346.1 DNA repair protein RecO [Bacteroidales bacterium]